MSGFKSVVYPFESYSTFKIKHLFLLLIIKYCRTIHDMKLHQNLILIPLILTNINGHVNLNQSRYNIVGFIPLDYDLNPNITLCRDGKSF